jgi:hypothetical protein
MIPLLHTLLVRMFNHEPVTSCDIQTSFGFGAPVRLTDPAFRGNQLFSAYGTNCSRIFRISRRTAH